MVFQQPSYVFTPCDLAYRANRSRHVLVTGSTGFIGAHVVDNLLDRGFSVRGATRSAAKGEQMKASRPQYASKLDFVVVDDFTNIGVFDAAMEGIDAVIHVASVCSILGVATSMTLTESAAILL
jgi:nucleoside-diphosphate-sugar epimerase